MTYRDLIHYITSSASEQALKRVIIGELKGVFIKVKNKKVNELLK